MKALRSFTRSLTLITATGLCAIPAQAQDDQAGFATLFEATGDPSLPLPILMGGQLPLLGGVGSVVVMGEGYSGGLLLLGLTAQTAFPVTHGSYDLSFYVNPSVVIPFFSGFSELQLSVPNNPAFVGLDIASQALVNNAQGAMAATSLVLWNIGTTPTGSTMEFAMVFTSTIHPQKDETVFCNTGGAVHVTISGTTNRNPLEIRTGPAGTGQLLDTIQTTNFNKRVLVPAGQQGNPAYLYLYNPTNTSASVTWEVDVG